MLKGKMARGEITAYSAGSQPAGEVHPLSIKYLNERGISTEGLKSQSWDDFAANQPDVVITVCDSAAKEQCPVWFGNCVKVHWGLPDPSKLQGYEDEIKKAFFSVMDTIEKRVQRMLALDLDNMKDEQLALALNDIAREIS